ncbi:cation:proton antiporter [Neolewinella sp.]|uniref:cation:proton antiporter n=1 Tax=Neolewinella sp. TaxID=2993543 RepID=UPI003B51A934
MLLLNSLDLSLPLTDPVLKFLVILLIILFAPILLNRIKIPQLLGLIIAGAIVGPFGLNLMERDSGIILSGTVGLLYIMFLAGLEIDLGDFKKNATKSVGFGLVTFTLPMVLGTLAGYYVLQYSLMTSVLLASMFASHTLIAYPLVSKLGIAKNKAVNITVGGTMITDTLALLVLAVIVGMTQGEVNGAFWLRLSVSILVFGAIVLLVFPLIGRWFFKRFDDNTSQYIFVLAMVFLGAVLAELAGIEPIIGAFLAGLALNRLIPHTSPLMNRIEFVGNAIFIPFFLIGVGMLIDYRAFVEDTRTLQVGGVMILVACVSKYAAAALTQRAYKLSGDERDVIFGLSNAQAAATLAAVLVGYNIVVGTTEAGEPIRLLNENVLNGTILMILATCTIASLFAQRGAGRIAALEEQEPTVDEDILNGERILIPLSNAATTEELVNLGVTIKTPKKVGELYALSIMDNTAEDASRESRAKKILHKATTIAAATDTALHELLRYDLNLVNGISSVVKEHKISDLILGLHVAKGISDSFLGHLTDGILQRCNVTTLIYKPAQPFGTISRHLVLVPDRAEEETGFDPWLDKLWNMSHNSGATVVIYGGERTLAPIRERQERDPIECTFVAFNDWNDFLILSRDVRPNDNLVIVMSRRDKPSFQKAMHKVPGYLNKYFQASSFLLIYPMQEGVGEAAEVGMRDATMLEPLLQINKFGRSLSGVLRRPGPELQG